ncbi:hypothetical protein MNL08_04080 [Bartonella krasnovii]|uniref:hypothetical protein n=1 Tax=Bartonella krasnovii TaxID=2267275 RepID=UPI001F4CF2E4|nr:hypothetical protein [Bartonella krasnovii]UNF43009.1 hypothetical protein MNL08_04080 [Bartonella krasnovii]UNF44552.1 hypothetical protein MNL07_03485 [Bartonella krasnovii]UNF56219.1 hypothetical protein MNL00_04090 [Bartonella krasnovii]
MAKVYLSTSWDLERIAPYFEEILASLSAYVERFKHEVTLQELIEAICTGKKQLWLVLDEDEGFLAAVTTQIQKTVLGKKRALICECSGKGVLDQIENLKVVEDWARDNGAFEIEILGRLGWKRTLDKQGYRVEMLYYKKEL